jgi:hypothetical protein
MSWHTPRCDGQDGGRNLQGRPAMTNKILFALIAFGLWANALGDWTRPAKADAESSLSEIARDVHAMATACRHMKICD